jgi:hypothetical protein
MAVRLSAPRACRPLPLRKIPSTLVFCYRLSRPQGWKEGLLCTECLANASATSEHSTYLLTYGAEPFLRSRQLCSPSRTSQHFMELEGSSPCSQGPPLVPILSQIDPVHTFPSHLSKIYFNIVHPLTSEHSTMSTIYLKLNCIVLKSLVLRLTAISR